MKNLYLLFFPLVFTLTLSAQSDVLNKGQNAIGIGVGYDIQDEVGVVNVHGSYTINGKLDLGLSYTVYGVTEGDDSSLNIVSIGAHYLLLKQGGSVPVNFGTGVSYGIINFSDDELKDLGIDLSGSQMQVFATLSRALNPNASVRFIPRVKGGLLRTTASVTDGTEKFTESENGFAGSVGISVAINVGKNLLAFDPRVMFGEGGTAYGLGVSFFFVN